MVWIFVPYLTYESKRGNPAFKRLYRFALIGGQGDRALQLADGLDAAVVGKDQFIRHFQTFSAVGWIAGTLGQGGFGARDRASLIAQVLVEGLIADIPADAEFHG